MEAVPIVKHAHNGDRLYKTVGLVKSGDPETAQSGCGKRLHKAGGDAVICLWPVSLHGITVGMGNAASSSNGKFLLYY